MHTMQIVCLSQEIAAYQSMDAIANNLANLSTAGFKREEPQFEEYLAHVGATPRQPLSLVQQASSYRDTSAGPLEMTHAPFDLAINGNGFFVIQTANGPRYTRDGHFSLDASGRIVTAAGDPLQGEGGDIQVSSNDGDVHVASDGTVSGEKGQIGHLQLADFADDSALTKEGGSLYATSQAPQTPANARIQQGAIEGSNVNAVVEISHMIEVMRSFQATSGLSESHSTLMRQAIDKLATTQS
jgi:flagellar basal-body rod protein FlgF